MPLFYFYLLSFPLIWLGFRFVRGAAPGQARLWLAVASMLFLALADFRSFCILLAVTGLNYQIIRRMPRSAGPALAMRALGLGISLLPLVYCKWQAGDEGVFALLPLGLAFYALQQCTAILDAPAMEGRAISLKDYLFFSFFFASVMAGPIICFRDMQAQLDANPAHAVSREGLNQGVSLFVFGLAKAVLLAEPLGVTSDQLLLAAEQGVSLTLTELGYVLWGKVLWFYFVFSAYSDMAIGMGLAFAIRLPINFNSPFKASSAVDYIARWHMSFMAFARHYIFTPAFRVLRNNPLRDTHWRYLLGWAGALFLVYLFVGLWHVTGPQGVALSLGVACLLVLIELGKQVPLFRQGNWPLPLRMLAAVTGRLLLLAIIGYCALAFTHPSLDLRQLVMRSVAEGATFSLSPRLEVFGRFLPSDGLSFSGFFPSLSTALIIPGWPPGFSALHILVCTAAVFLMPNTMQLFGLIDDAASGVPRWRWRYGPAYAIALGGLLFLAVSLSSSGDLYVYNR